MAIVQCGAAQQGLTERWWVAGGSKQGHGVAWPCNAGALLRKQPHENYQRVASQLDHNCYVNCCKWVSDSQRIIAWLLACTQWAPFHSMLLSPFGCTTVPPCHITTKKS